MDCTGPSIKVGSRFSPISNLLQVGPTSGSSHELRKNEPKVTSGAQVCQLGSCRTLILHVCMFCMFCMMFAGFACFCMFFACCVTGGGKPINFKGINFKKLSSKHTKMMQKGDQRVRLASPPTTVVKNAPGGTLFHSFKS